MSTQDGLARSPRFEPPAQTFRLGRASFLGLSAASAAALLLGGRSGASLDFFTGVTSLNGFTIYTITAGYPAFDAATYRLRVGGMVSRPLSLSLDEIMRLPSVTETRFYQCVTGWKVPNATWTGVPLRLLLDRVQPQASAHALKFYSFDGLYTESLTIDQAMQSDVLLAYKLQRKPLARAQGAPLRLVVPGMYGYKFIKWLDRIELIPKPIDGYWEQGGYDRDAYIRTDTSKIH